MKALFNDAQFRRRALFVVSNLMIVAFLLGVVVPPVGTLFADRDGRIEQQRKALGWLTAIAIQTEKVQSVIFETKAQMQGGEFLAGPNDNVVSADLQTKLKAMTELAGAQVRAVQALPAKTVEQIRYSGSRIEIQGSLQSLVRAIHAIENSKPYLFIGGAVLRNPPATRPGLTEEPVLQAQLDIFGAIQPGGQP